LILQSFVQEFGVKVLATPPAQGFNLLAWGIPVMAFAGGLVLVGFVIRQWLHRPQLATAGGPPVSSFSSAELDRVRRQIDEETEE
jgi:cytochrome c-type biogenesis protein CcmH/NrfF